MEIRKLNTDEVTYVYNEHMKMDFPAYELKSLKKILKLTNEEKCTPCGFYKNDELVGYAILISYKNFVILDYFAILRTKRNGGLGAEAINLITEYCKDKYDIFILESDDPSYFEKQEDKDICERRIEFYKRNGFEQAKFKTKAYQGHFIVLTKNDKIKDVNKTVELYYGLYTSISSEQKCKENVSAMLI